MSPGAQGALRRFQRTETHLHMVTCVHTHMCKHTHTHAPSLVADPAKDSLGKGPETIQAQDPPSPGRGLSASEVPSMGRGVRVPLVCAPVGAEVSPALELPSAGQACRSAGPPPPVLAGPAGPGPGPASGAAATLAGSATHGFNQQPAG